MSRYVCVSNIISQMAFVCNAVSLTSESRWKVDDEWRGVMEGPNSLTPAAMGVGASIPPGVATPPGVVERGVAGVTIAPGVAGE